MTNKTTATPATPATTPAILDCNDEIEVRTGDDVVYVLGWQLSRHLCRTVADYAQADRVAAHYPALAAGEVVEYRTPSGREFTLRLARSACAHVYGVEYWLGSRWYRARVRGCERLGRVVAARLAEDLRASGYVVRVRLVARYGAA